jgi:hypothetical protein
MTFARPLSTRCCMAVCRTTAGPTAASRMDLKPAPGKRPGLCHCGESIAESGRARLANRLARPSPFRRQRWKCVAARAERGWDRLPQGCRRTSTAGWPPVEAELLDGKPGVRKPVRHVQCFLGCVTHDGVDVSTKARYHPSLIWPSVPAKLLNDDSVRWSGAGHVESQGSVIGRDCQHILGKRQAADPACYYRQRVTALARLTASICATVAFVTTSPRRPAPQPAPVRSWDRMQELWPRRAMTAPPLVCLFATISLQTYDEAETDRIQFPNSGAV